MLQAMLSGVASIKAQQTRMNVIGNNLANVNTTAYKGTRVSFTDMMAQTVRGATRPTDSRGGLNPIQYGLGVLTSGTDGNMEQGSLNATNRQTDFAIQGHGFFAVSNGDRIAYTRDGTFDLDANGYLVHRSTGERLLGWSANPVDGSIDTNAPVGESSALQIPIGQRTAVQQTTEVTWAGNLDSREFNRAGTATTSSLVRVYDPLGGAHDVTVTLTEGTTPNTWNWSVSGTTLTATGSGTITFNPTDGTIASGGTGSATFTPPPASGVPAFDVDMDFSAFSQLATDMQIQAANQNGYGPGSLQNYSVGADGVITGIYTNGLTRPLGQFAMAIFSNPAGLERQGSNLYRNTDNSGVPVIGAPRSGGRGQVNAGFLEQSNVDIGTEFTDLIVTQRGFQANTRVVTTVDEMLQDLINMKR
ncbi:MAG: flagellar hook protein FlgE [Fimbriimonadaceae bacterium]